MRRKNERGENERGMRLKMAGEKRREWILNNNQKYKVSVMQSILKSLIAAGVDASSEKSDMREMKSEVMRIERFRKVREMRREWVLNN